MKKANTATPLTQTPTKPQGATFSLCFFTCLTHSCKAQMSNTPTQFQACCCSAVLGYFRSGSPPSCRQSAATHRWGVWTTDAKPAEGSMQGIHLPSMKAAAGVWDRPGTMDMQLSTFLGSSLLTAGSWAGQGRAQLLHALTILSRGCQTPARDAATPVIMLWIQVSISGREGSTHWSSVYSIVFIEFYTAQSNNILQNRWLST